MKAVVWAYKREIRRKILHSDYRGDDPAKHKPEHA